MNDLKQKLEQAKEDKKLAIATADKEIARLEAELKPRHGDYGIGKSHSGDTRCRLKEKGCISNEFGVTDTELHKEQDVWLGNIFDDLKRNSKDLREFEVTSDGEINTASGLFSLQRGGNGMDWITCNNHCFTIDKLIEIHQKLGQMIATMKRDVAKEEKK